MDLQAGILCVTFAVISAFVIYYIIASSMKEKTYDEAMADRRKKTEEQYGTTKTTKEKIKDKKTKKAGKKVKEKIVGELQNGANTSENEQDQHNKPQHVAFVEEPEVAIVTEDTVLVSEDKDRKKPKKKEKPILLNKNEPTLLVDNPPHVLNHFEKIHPKDDLELKRSHSHEEVRADVTREQAAAPAKEQTSQKQPKSKSAAAAGKLQNETQQKQEKKAQSQAQPPKSNPSAEKAKADKNANHESKKEQKTSNAKQQSSQQQQQQQQPQPAAQPQSLEAIVISQPAAPPLQSEKLNALPIVIKSNKKKKSDLSVLQQMSGDKEVVNVNLLIPLVRKAEMSRSEIQLLIDTLLNKQSDSTDISSEWVENRQDPMMKLKKQLADKERDLVDEQEKTLGLHNRVKELRTELNSEKHNVRSLEVLLQTRQAEIASIAVKLQHANEEKQGQAQQIQQLQNKLGEERRLALKMQEENGQAQGAFQQELLAQRQQTEIIIARLNEQTLQQQETIANLEAQLNNQMQEHEALTGELNMLRKERSTHMQDSAVQVQDLIRQIEDQRAVQANLHHVLATTQFENTTLKNEVGELKEQLSLSSSENEKISAAIQNIQAENKRLTLQVSSACVEATQLRNENETLAAQVTASMERPATEGRENGDSNNYSESKLIDDQNSLQNKDMPLEIKGQLKSKELTIESLTSELQTYKTEVTDQQSVMQGLKEEVAKHKQEADRLTAELTQQKALASRLNEQLESQLAKNNELRTKNWKVMEALTATENSLQIKIRESQILENQAAEKMLQDQQSSTRKLLLRIFPEINVPESKDQSKWLEQFDSALSLWKSKTTAEPPTDLAELEKQNAQLQNMVSHYKKIIADTEGMLNRLQSHVEQEEGKWREEMQTLQSQLDIVTNERDALQASNGAHQKTTNGYCLIDDGCGKESD